MKINAYIILLLVLILLSGCQAKPNISNQIKNDQVDYGTNLPEKIGGFELDFSEYGVPKENYSQLTHFGSCSANSGGAQECAFLIYSDKSSKPYDFLATHIIYTTIQKYNNNPSIKQNKDNLSIIDQIKNGEIVWTSNLAMISFKFLTRDYYGSFSPSDEIGNYARVLTYYLKRFPPDENQKLISADNEVLIQTNMATYKFLTSFESDTQDMKTSSAIYDLISDTEFPITVRVERYSKIEKLQEKMGEIMKSADTPENARIVKDENGTSYIMKVERRDIDGKKTYVEFDNEQTVIWRSGNDIIEIMPNYGGLVLRNYFSENIESGDVSGAMKKWDRVTEDYVSRMRPLIQAYLNKYPPTP